MPKPMVYKDETGEKYKISYSEELQLKNLRAQQKTHQLLKASLYAKAILIAVMLVWFILFLYLLYRIDAVDLLTELVYR